MAAFVFKYSRYHTAWNSPVNLNYLPDLLSLLPLGWAFIALWQHRKRFSSLVPFILGAAFLMVARLLDVLIEHPAVAIHGWIGTSRPLFDQILNYCGNLADILGVLFLVIGFVRTIKFLQSEEEKIQTLEGLLPICANCKKIKSNVGEWQPVEQYLEENGSPPLTHGLCPDCAVKMRQDLDKYLAEKKTH
jgi:hypothetical protein